MERHNFITSSTSEADEGLLDMPVRGGGEQVAVDEGCVDRLADSIKLQLPANFSYEAYCRIRDDESCVISDDLLPALQATYQLSVVRDHEAARRRSIQTIDAIVARADAAQIRFDSLIDGARQMPEYVSALVVDMAQGGEVEREANDRIVSALQVIADLLEEQREDVRMLKRAGLEIERAMSELEVSSQFLAACVVQAKTPRPVFERSEQVRAAVPPMPSSPPRLSTESIDQSDVSMNSGAYEGVALDWDGPVVDPDRIRQKRSNRARGGGRYV